VAPCKGINNSPGRPSPVTPRVARRLPRVRVRMLPGGEEKTVELPEGARAGDLLRLLGLERESHVVMVDGSPVPEEDPLPEGAREIVVVRVLSGG